MFIVNIINAIKVSLAEKSRKSRQFRMHQQAIYKEGLTEVKLYEQLNNIVEQMNADDSIHSVRVAIAPEAMPFLSSALEKIHVEVVNCASDSEIILLKDNTTL